LPKVLRGKKNKGKHHARIYEAGSQNKRKDEARDWGPARLGEKHSFSAGQMKLTSGQVDENGRGGRDRKKDRRQWTGKEKGFRGEKEERAREKARGGESLLIMGALKFSHEKVPRKTGQPARFEKKGKKNERGKKV